MLSSDRRGWAVTGLVGSTCIMSLFAIVVAGEQALSVTAQRSQPNLGAIEGVWTLHNSVFTILDLSIAVALLGLSRAGVAAGITPQVFTRLAPVCSSSGRWPDRPSPPATRSRCSAWPASAS
jgi:hypothetical protein